jgi:hypothetical protein
MALRAMAWAILAMACLSNGQVKFGKNYPVSRVVGLLNDMKTQLEKEQDADEEIYSKMACWCETNDKAKTKAIADAEARISTLDNTIEKMTALSQTLNTEIEGLKKEIEKNQKSLEVATALREKQLAEFNEEEKEMIESISALKNAIVVLSKHHDGSAAAFLNNKVVMKALATAKALSEKHMVLLQGTITPSQRRLISNLAKDQQPTYQAYKPQSGEIFGILNQMRETFEADLSTSQKEELAAAAAYKDLKAAKEEEIATGQESLATKEQELAKADEKNAQAQQDKEDTLASLSADQKFLMELKEKCSLTDKEWDARQQARHEELQAIATAISILHSDNNRDLFSKTFNPSFLQVSSASKAQREHAAAMLAQFPKLAAVATSVRLDDFTEVKKAIDKMVKALEDESVEEIKHKDYCIDGLHENEVETQEKLHTKEGQEAKIAGLEQDIKEADVQIKTLTTEIEEIQVQLKRAGEDREAERKDFEGVVSDQRESQVVLNEALSVLKEVYGDGVVLTQISQEPPAGFDTYKKNTGSTGVIALINQIIADAKELEAKTVHDEQNAQKAYEGLVKDSNDSIEAKTNAKTDLEGQRATDEQDLTTAKGELDGTVGELESLSDGVGALHKSCDYTLKNFDVRQEARAQEIDALQKAKAYLSGMKL